MLGGPIPGAAGANGAIVVTTDGAGIIAGLGGATGKPGEEGEEIGWFGGDWKKAFASRAIIAWSGQLGGKPGMSTPAVEPGIGTSGPGG
jgi:hypothetical protein